MAKKPKKKKSDKATISVQVSQEDKDQLEKAATEVYGVSASEVIRMGINLASYIDPSFWKMLNLMAERSFVGPWTIAFLAITDLYAQFAAEDLNFLRPTTLERVKKLERIYNKDPGELVKRITMEYSAEFNKTRASEREGI